MQQLLGHPALDLLPTDRIAPDRGRHHGAEIGQEDRLVVAVARAQIGQHLAQGVETERRVVLLHGNFREPLGILLRQLQFFGRPRAEPLLVVERKERVPHVVEHLLRALPGRQHITATDLRQPVVAEEVAEPRRHRAARHGGRTREIEPVGRLDTVPLDADVVDERQHAELLEPRMRRRASAFALLERAFADQPFLRFERPLVEDGAAQGCDQLPGQSLLRADGLELPHVMFVAGRIVFADLLLAAVQVVEVGAQIGAAGPLHVVVQLPDARFDLALVVLAGRILAIAQKTAALRQMIQRAAERMTVRTLVEIQPFGQRTIAVAIGITVRPVVRPLPFQELVDQRIALRPAPFVQRPVGKRGAEVVSRQHLEQCDLAQAPPEIVAPQRTCVRPVLHGRFFAVLLPGHTLLKDVDPLIDQPVSVLPLLHERPTDGVGSQIQTQYFRHKKTLLRKIK